MTWVLIGLGLASVVAVLVLLRMVETTYIRLGRARAAGLDEADDTDGRLDDLTHDRETALGPVTMLRVAAQVTVVAVVAVLAANRWSVGGTIVVVAATTLALFTFGEAIPRRWALESNDRMARVLVRPARVLGALAPLRWLAAPAHALARVVGPKAADPESSEVTGDELVAMAEAAAEARLLPDDEAHLIGSIIELGDTIVREVMVPRPDMVTVSADASIESALHLVVESGFTRLPVIGDGADDVAGIVLAKDLVAAHLAGHGSESPGDRDGLVRDAQFVPETKGVLELMREMQASKFHLAVVIDEYGGTAGVVSLEDIIEEMVGEIVDEFDDEVELIEHLDDGRLVLAGRLPASELTDLLDLELPEGDWDTVGGLVFDLLGHVPDAGESVDYSGWRFSAAEVEGRRISLVEVERCVPGAVQGEDSTDGGQPASHAEAPQTDTPQTEGANG